MTGTAEKREKADDVREEEEVAGAGLSQAVQGAEPLRAAAGRAALASVAIVHALSAMVASLAMSDVRSAS